MFLLKAEQMKRYEKEKVGIIFLTCSAVAVFNNDGMTKKIYWFLTNYDQFIKPTQT